MSEIQDVANKAEFLIREVQHRVYNNLQLMNSLLSVHEPFMRDRDDRRLLQDCGYRMQLLGMIFREFYDKPDKPSVVISEFLDSLLMHIGMHYNRRPNEIKFIDSSACQDRMELNRIISLSLLLYEFFLLFRDKHVEPPIEIEVSRPDVRIGLEITIRFYLESSVPAVELLKDSVSAALIPCFLKQSRATMKFLQPENAEGFTYLVISLSE